MITQNVIIRQGAEAVKEISSSTLEKLAVLYQGELGAQSLQLQC